MKQIIFQRGDQQFEALLIRLGKKNMRVGWTEGTVPSYYAKDATLCATRPGIKTVKLPLIGPGAVNVVRIDDAREIMCEGTDGETAVLGAATAELAKRLAFLVRERQLTEHLEVLCSHAGVYRGQRSHELREAGVSVCQLAMFLGDEHAFATKLGVADIAVAEKSPPHRTLVLLEIEESKTGTKPKAAVSDGFLPFLADRLEIVERTHMGRTTPRTLSMEGAEIWVGYHPRKRMDASRTERLEARLNAFLIGRPFEPGQGPSAVHLFNAPPTELYDKIELRMADLLASRFPPGVDATE